MEFKETINEKVMEFIWVNSSMVVLLSGNVLFMSILKTRDSVYPVLSVD